MEFELHIYITNLSGERACPTVLVDAVRLLRAKVEKSHGVGRCISCPQLDD